MQSTLLKSFFLAGAATAALAGAAFAQDREIDEIVVYGDGSQIELTDPYAGGQVARGGRAGLLGNLDFLDAPFSGTAYTQEIIEAQQSESIGDVLQNDPVVRVAKGFGNFQEVYVVRGFPVFSDDMTLNGLFGILPRQFVAAELFERVEVFRGANAFVNGAAPGGSAVGGAINLVPKRAPDDGVRRLTLGYENAGQFYGAADLGTRLGDSGEWGVRFNAVYRDGESSVEDQDRDLKVFSLGTDYAGDYFRFSADIGYQDNRIDNPRPQVTPPATGVPAVPDPDVNYAQTGTFTDEEQLFGVARAELDISDYVTVWAAAGARSGEENNILANPTADIDGDTSAYRFDNAREDLVLSADVGARAEFETGAVGHNAVVSASIIDLDSKNAYAFSAFSGFPGNLYNPAPIAVLPEPDFFVGGVLSDPLSTEKVTNKSVAFADTLSLFDDRLLLTGGLRYQAIKTRTFDYNSGAELSRYDEDAVTPAFGAVFKLSPAFSLYGNYAESLQPGSVAPASSGGTPITNAGEILDPFKGDQMEVGAKFDGGTFGATVSLFSISRQNAIVVDQVFQASGEQQNRGVELSVFGEPAEGVRLLGGLTYVDAELEETEGGVNEGNTVIGVPEVQANINGEWDLPFAPGFTLDGRVVYTGEQYVNETNTVELEDWARLDLGIRYKTQISEVPLTFRARVDNVTDKGYWASSGGYPGANYLIQGAPRTFMATVSADF